MIGVNNSRVHSTCASSSRTRAISLSALVVWVRPDFGSKSRTLSTSAQRLVRVSYQVADGAGHGVEEAFDLHGAVAGHGASSGGVGRCSAAA